MELTSDSQHLNKSLSMAVWGLRSQCQGGRRRRIPVAYGSTRPDELVSSRFNETLSPKQSCQQIQEDTQHQPLAPGTYVHTRAHTHTQQASRKEGCYPDLQIPPSVFNYTPQSSFQLHHRDRDRHTDSFGLL